MAERAAQFSPFAALVGYEEAIRETGRLTGQQVELSEEEKAILDQKQQIILAALEQGERPEITVVYFQRDKKKAGGEYTDFTGLVKQGKEVENVLLFTDGTEIPFSDIIEINKLLFAWRVSLEEKKNCTDTAKSTSHLTGAFCL